MSKMIDGTKSPTNGPSKKSETGRSTSSNAPKNARVVKNSAKTGTISRAAARAAVKELMKDR